VEHQRHYAEKSDLADGGGPPADRLPEATPTLLSRDRIFLLERVKEPQFWWITGKG